MTIATLALAVRVAAAPSSVVDPVRFLTGHTDSVHAVAFFPDGKRIVSASSDTTVRVWDVVTGRALLKLEGHEKPVLAVDVSSDGKLIASAGADLTARVWDAQTGAQVAQLTGHTRAIRGVAFLPGNRLLTGATQGDGTVRIWDLKNEKELWRIDADDCVLALSVSKDGTRVAFGGCDGTIKVWDLSTRTRLAKFVPSEKGRPIEHLALSPDGRLVYAETSLGLRPFDVQAGDWAKNFTGVQNVRGFALSPDAKWLITSMGFLADAQTGEYWKRLKWVINISDRMACEAFSADSRWLALGTEGTNATIFKSQPGRNNYVVLYALPVPLPNPVPTTAPTKFTGSISWEPIPARVRDAKGTMVPYKSVDEYQEGGLGFWKVCSGTYAPPGGAKPQPLDLLYHDRAILLQREPGILDVVPLPQTEHGPGQGVRDAGWDGECFWLVSPRFGLVSVNARGQMVTRLGKEQGLPIPCSAGICLHVLDRGRLLVAGSSSDPNKADGWCALVEPNPGATPPYRVKVIFRETELPGWREKGRVKILQPEHTAFVPLFFSEPPPGDVKRPREVWLFCDWIPRSKSPIVRVNVQTGAFTTFNLEPIVTTGPRPRLGTGPFAVLSPPFWLNESTFLGCTGRSWFAMTVEPDKTFLDIETAKVVCQLSTDQAHSALSWQGKIYIPSQPFVTVDLPSLNTWKLGQGPPTAEISAFETEYFVSPLLGLAAFSPMDGNLYRVSTDPAHPLAHHPEPEAAIVLSPIPAPGLIEYGAAEFGPGSITFRGGLGEVSFIDGKLVTKREMFSLTHMATIEVERQRGISIGEVNTLLRRLQQYASERKRIGMTAEAEEKLKGFTRVEAPPFAAEDRSRLEELYAAFDRAPDVQKSKATEPLFAEAQRLGEQWAGEANDYLASRIAILTKEQWQMLRYEVTP